MLPPPDPRTLDGQVRICYGQSALAVSSLGNALGLLVQVQDASDAAQLIRLLDATQAHLTNARKAAVNFAGMVLPCAGSI
ncbi:hypothetical protein M2323_004033 [Rhodoblastus acidophilus]|uniref:hypothetical protein n=1 Tax=Rhodoblastus acidophilus TaxID=1074 RepID=UPI00222481C9|nr:hypothetical protein [Rhodoblastus acidophilus]MCW2286228.1 hypothetical protein [Rhodoblastus acidophilus]MCW2335089.1 hypothetical protein [Rhodoblastus acidophilus]